MIRRKYRRVTPKIQYFPFRAVLFFLIAFLFVFLFNCVFNLCTSSLLHEISSLTSNVFLNSAKWKILEIQGLRVGIYYVSFLLRFLQIDKNIPCLLAAQKRSFYVWNFCVQATWKQAFWTLPLLTKLNIWKQNWLKCTPAVLSEIEVCRLYFGTKTGKKLNILLELYF